MRANLGEHTITILLLHVTREQTRRAHNNHILLHGEQT